MLFFPHSHTFTAKPPLKKKVFARSKVGGDGGASSSAALLAENCKQLPQERSAVPPFPKKFAAQYFSGSPTFAFGLPISTKTEHHGFAVVLCFGGDGGNRNRVRKFAHITFYMLSLCFGIPFPCRSQTSCRDW